jgi:hypothetical protein
MSAKYKPKKAKACLKPSAARRRQGTVSSEPAEEYNSADIVFGFLASRTVENTFLMLKVT